MVLYLEPLNMFNLSKVYLMQLRSFGRKEYFARFNTLMDTLIMPKYEGYLAFNKKWQLVGYISIKQEKHSMYFMTLCIDPKFQNNGYGTQLLKKMLFDVYPSSLHVRRSNKKAQHVYEKLGFRASDEITNFYKKPTENAILMVRTIHDK